MKNIIYKEVKDLGFKRFDYEDKVYTNIHGHEPFEMKKKLSDNVEAFWCEKDFTIMVKRLKDNHVQHGLECDTIEDYKQIEKLFI